jgi:hypothetical protein
VFSVPAVVNIFFNNTQVGFAITGRIEKPATASKKAG